MATKLWARFVGIPVLRYSVLILGPSSLCELSTVLLLLMIHTVDDINPALP